MSTAMSTKRVFLDTVARESAVRAREDAKSDVHFPLIGMLVGFALFLVGISVGIGTLTAVGFIAYLGSVLILVAKTPLQEYQNYAATFLKRLD